jgi:hypothetical protein
MLSVHRSSSKGSLRPMSPPHQAHRRRMAQPSLLLWTTAVGGSKRRAAQERGGARQEAGKPKAVSRRNRSFIVRQRSGPNPDGTWPTLASEQ